MITGQNVKNTYVGDGSTRQWNITFDFNDSSQIKFKVNGTEITTNYSFNSVAKTLTYPTVESELDPLTSADEITIYRETPITQDIDFTNGGPLNAEMIEDGLDKLTMISQEIKDIAQETEKKGLVSQLPNGTDIDALLDEGVFYIENPTGTKPTLNRDGNDLSFDRCIIEVKKVPNTNLVLQIGYFSYYTSGMGYTVKHGYTAFSRQMGTGNFTVIEKEWKALSNQNPLKFSISLNGTEAEFDVSLMTSEVRPSIITTDLSTGITKLENKIFDTGNGYPQGEFKIVFKTGNSFTVNWGRISSAVINSTALSAYEFSANTIYEVSFVRIDGSHYIAKVFDCSGV